MRGLRAPRRIGGDWRSLALLVLAALAVTAVGPCDRGSNLPHPEALVVYNVNHPDAAAIAQHYAVRRGLEASQLCPIEVPVGQFGSKDHLLAARDAILEQCVCSLIPPAVRPDPCDISNVAAVRTQSKVTHLVLIRGIPPRLYGTGWPSDFEELSFDFYLSYLVYRNEDIFAPGTSGVTYSTYFTMELSEQATDLMILSAPPLDPALHKDVAYGRIEAMDLERTLDLIDRTLEAENYGVTGNFLDEKDVDGFEFLADLTASHAPECTSYITHEPSLFDSPESSWPPVACRAGTTTVTAKGPDPGSTSDDPVSRILPGSFISTVPRAVDVGLLLGSTPWPNDQTGFNSFDTLVNWRKTPAPCVPLCADLPSQVERDACVAQSTDWFQELNSACVGVARGFIGHQIRSYPVQYYGFFPAGWLTNQNGSVEKTPPRVLVGGAYQDARFSDDRYLHFGESSVDVPDESSCRRVDGAVEPCPERIALKLTRPIGFLVPIDLEVGREFLVRVRHRHPANPGGSIDATLRFFDGAGASVARSATLPVDAEHLDWVTTELLFTIGAGELAQIQQINIELTAGLADALHGFLDLDAFELVDSTSGSQLLDPDDGSFVVDAQDSTHPGDWAANAIDRLGAIAWWGSSSHHLHFGWSFSMSERFYGAFFMGRSLGESLLLMDQAEAGIIYGDPLYRPVAVRIHIPGWSDYGEPPGLAVDPTNLAQLRIVLLNAFHGSANASGTRWSLASCPILDPVACGGAGLWIERPSGSTAVLDLPVDWTQFVDLGNEQDLVLRLRVWNPGEDDDELFHHAYFHWSPQ